MEDWKTRGSCRSKYPIGLFYPSKRTDPTIPFAKMICKTCPVQKECLHWAIQNDEPEGIWGGTEPEERLLLSLLFRKDFFHNSAAFTFNS